MRKWTDLDAEYDRSRRGLRPISARVATDLGAEYDRSRRCQVLGEGLAQDVQPHAAQAQRSGVEVLQARSARKRAIPRVLPQPLPDRVRRRLPRPSQVAVQLEAQE